MQLPEEVIAGARKVVAHYTSPRYGKRASAEPERNLWTDIQLIIALQKAEKDDFAPDVQEPVTGRHAEMVEEEREHLQEQLQCLLRRFWTDAARWLGMGPDDGAIAYEGEEGGGDVRAPAHD
jgi:hypothetical protein